MRAAVLLILCILTPAYAQDASTPPEGAASNTPGVSEVDFHAVDVRARGAKPSIAVIPEQQPRQGRSFLRLRDDFSRELTQSVTQVQ